MSKYERFGMLPKETIQEMFTRFTNITNKLVSLGRSIPTDEQVRKILRSMPQDDRWRTKVTALFETKDFTKFNIEQLAGSLMTHELHLDDVVPESSRNRGLALKAEELEESEPDEEEAAMLVRRMKILYRNFKPGNQKGRNFARKIDSSKTEQGCFKCGETGHQIRDCPQWIMTKEKERQGIIKERYNKSTFAKPNFKKAMIAVWGEATDSKDDEEQLSEETANLCLMAKIDGTEQVPSNEMIFNLTAKKLISHDAETSSENLRENFVAFIKGLISFPLDIPGTTYHECLQGRKKAMKMLKNMLQERRMMPRKQNTDFYDYVLVELAKEETLLTEGIALDLMFVLLFASFETTSLALTVALKYLSDYPLVLQKLTEEHEAILKKRENPDSHLTWSEYKSMTFTFQFINETVRLANIVPGIFRKALKDVSYKGYTIPAGWGVMVCPPAVHLNPAIYENPLDFNPSRWEGGEINGASKHFMAFGGGMRFCVGTDFTKVQMAVFLHCLVTKYRWNPVKGGNIVRTPGLQFPDGFHVQLSEKRSTET
ncbi:cytochrome P450 87A3-like [Spinacia oleracea]|uniref:Cytochrome P450 87A3-like n=1 Tax=Spinacia oleracea TaxID=3562 RepID=A0ABM3QYV3_SPIOL|nr:cytochrome P450 87A3-like [Spinacia oleracea]